MKILEMIFCGNKKIVLSHAPTPDKLLSEGYINVHGHIHNNDLYECIEKYSPDEYSKEKHVNISCDVTNFKPINIKKIISI